MNTQNWQLLFTSERQRLMALAYRMTGSASTAQDILQEAWIKVQPHDLAALVRPRHWLSTVVIRLCLDDFRKAKRESYIGPWLPEPLIASPSPEDDWMRAEDLGIGLLLLLDRLPPQMRAAYLLHDAFSLSHEEIAQALDISTASSRQMISRARARLSRGPKIPPTFERDQLHALASAFWRASRDGDMVALMALMAPDVEVHTDGGGKVYAALKVIDGREKAARLFAGLAQKRQSLGKPLPPLVVFNGHVGFISDEGDALQVTALNCAPNGQLRSIWIWRNPDKLSQIK